MFIVNIICYFVMIYYVLDIDAMVNNKFWVYPEETCGTLIKEISTQTLFLIEIDVFYHLLPGFLIWKYSTYNKTSPHDIYY